MTLALRLQFARGGRWVFLRALDTDLIRIGRNPTCDVVLDGENICRIHAMIERALDGDAYTITNLGACGLTFLNGVSVSRAELAAGDQLRIGGYTISVDAVEAAQAPAPQIDDRDIVLIESDDLMIAAPIAKVLWAATAEEMFAEEPTGECSPIAINS